MLRVFLSIFLIVLALPALAQDEANWRFGGDAYIAGRSVTLSGEPVGDLFAAGDRVTARADVTGSAHMAGRNVTLDARVGQNFYGAGQRIDLEGPVAGNATILGESLSVTEPVSGNLRAMGAELQLTAPIAGSAVIAGEYAMIDGTIGGDVSLAVADIDWGDGAKVNGDLIVYADNPDDIPVPARVAASDQVTYRPTKSFEGMEDLPGAAAPSFIERLRNWLGGVIVVGVLGTIFAAVAPGYLAGLRERALARPVKSGVIGFVGLAALIGSVVLLAMTGVGLLLVPLSIIAAILLGITGYVIGAYVLGVWAVMMSGRPVPDNTGSRAAAAFIGAAIGALIGLIPWLGWLAVMAIFLVGAGALVARMLKWGDRVGDPA